MTEFSARTPIILIDIGAIPGRTYQQRLRAPPRGIWRLDRQVTTREPRDDAADGRRPPRTQWRVGSASSDPVCHPVVPCSTSSLPWTAPFGSGYPPARAATLKSPKIVPFGVVIAVLVLLLAACVHPSAPSSASGSSSSSSTSESTVSPSIEPATGLESPESPTGGPIAISMASVPVGKKDNIGGCIQIAWLVSPIPHGDIVTVTSVTVNRPFTFDQAATAHCKGGPSCVGYQFSAANDTNEVPCNVGLGYIGAPVDDENGDPTDGSMELAGHLSCPHIGSSECRNDAAVMQSSGGGSVGFEVGVDLPVSPPPSSSPTESPSSPPTTTPESPPPTTPTTS